jgi:two-component system sensor histidine kinase KdpD
LDLPPQQLLVLLDFVLISQVLVNLVDNALKYSPPDQPVEIRVRERADSVEIAVLDYGIGIAEPDLQSIFDRFHRGQRTVEAGGTGLGLSICRGFVEAHGGWIWAERRMPAGTIIAFTIPVSEKRKGSGIAQDERTGAASTRN